MNKLIAYFVKQGTFVNLLSLAVFVVGIYSLVKIRREVFPNINFDVITITTIFPGGSAESVEKLITNPLEQDLREVEGIKKMTSVSVEGSSIIVMQLDPDQTTDKDAKLDIEDVIDNFRDLPEDAEDPKATILESKLRPIITVSVSGADSEESLRKAAKDLERQIESISEVARVDYEGLRDFEVKVEAQPEKLRAFRLSLQDLINALQRQNVNIPGGTVDASSANASELVVRTVGEFESLKDIEDTVVRANALAEVIRVKDVAKVTQGFEKEKTRNLTNGKQSINLTVLKKDTADAINLVDKVRSKVDEFRPKLPSGVQISFINDLSYFVRRRLSVLSSNLIVGLILVLVVLSVFLPLRIASIAAFGIPFSFLGAIAVFYFTGVSINLLSLMGLIIVVGMLVDDAVVVTENIQYELERGMSPLDASVKGAQTIWLPVTASVLTTIAAFAPLLAMSGIFGKFVAFIPLGVIWCLWFSLGEAFFVLPHHIYAWGTSFTKATLTSAKKEATGFWYRFVTPPYRVLSSITIRFRYVVVVFVLALLGLSFSFAAKKMDFVLFPPGGIDTFYVLIEGSPGMSLNQTQKLLEPFESAIRDLPKSELQDFTSTIGIQGGDGGDPVNRKRGSEYAQITVFLTTELERQRMALDIIEDLKSRIVVPPEVKNVTYQRQQGGPPVGRPVNLGVRGTEYVDILPAVKDLREILVNMPGVFDLRDTYVEGKEEIEIKVATGEASAAGLSAREIGTGIRAAFEGIVPTSIRTLDEEIDVRVTLESKSRASEDTLRQLEIPNPRGNLITLPRVASWTKDRGIAVYEHENNLRQVTVTGDVDTTKTTSREANDALRKLLPDLQSKHPKVTFAFGGEDADTKESFQTLIEAFAFAFLGIILLMILTFGNLHQPLVVATTIPLGIVAVIWTFYLHKMPLSFLGIVGIIALAGVIVNNAIVMTDAFNMYRSEGKTLAEAACEAATRRLRPIFLTSFTTVVGVLPTAYGIGGLDPFVVPIALALGWGVGAGSVLTLIAFPAFLVIAEEAVWALKWPLRKLTNR